MLSEFLRCIDDWVLPGYSFILRYICFVVDGKYILCDASIRFNPISPNVNYSFEIDKDGICVGSQQLNVVNKDECLNLLKQASEGAFFANGHLLELPGTGGVSHYSEMAHRDLWFSELHLVISRGSMANYSHQEFIRFDSVLRLAQPPFDGLNEAAAFLGLKSPGTHTNGPSITIRVGSPVDIMFEKCFLKDDFLKLVFIAHAELNLKKLNVAVRSLPDLGLESRRQIASTILWQDTSDGTREGSAEIFFEHADSVQVMISIDGYLVRRQWLNDPIRAKNKRLLALQTFDKDLRKTKEILFEAKNIDKFEQAVSGLMFLLGFSPINPIEKEGPDIILMTPMGKLIVVECTSKIGDYHNKVGKLYQRRTSLTKHLEMNKMPATRVYSILVCSLPIGEIPIQTSQIQEFDTILIAREELLTAFDSVYNPPEPDDWIDQAQIRMSHGIIGDQSNLPF